MKIPKNIHNLCIGAAALAAASSLHAAPYASGCTNVGSGVIDYYLNATPSSGAVTITTYPSGAHPANTPATPAQGLNHFTVSGSDTSYTISVAQTGTGKPAAETIATANTPQTVWGGSPDPRGLDVNCYPTNGPVFGTVYMANAAAGGTGAQAKGKGILPCHSDMSLALGSTTAALATSTFSASLAGSGPYKVNVNRLDGTVMVSDIGSAAGTVYSFDPYIKTATMLLPPGNDTAGTGSPYHGEIYGAPKSTGSLATGNFVLYTFDYTQPAPAAVNSTFGGTAGGFGINAAYYDTYYLYNAATNALAPITGPNSLCNLNRYTIGSSVPVASLPDLTLNYGLNSVAGLPGDIEVGLDGKLFTTSERANAGSAAYLSCWDPSGQSNLFSSAASATDDLVRDQIEATGFDGGAPQGTLIRISPDGKYIGMLGYYCYIAIYKLTNGIPDLSTFTFINNETNSGGARAIAWDMADNVYMMNSGSGDVKVYDLGATEICTTSNDLTSMNGSFQITTPPAVSVLATTPMAYQANNSYNGNLGSATAAVFTFSMSPAPVVSTTVNFTLTGTATNAVNYTASSVGSVTFLPGATNETVTITPTASPAVGPTLSTVLTITGSSSYSATAPTAATAYIANSGAQTLYASSADTMYRGLPNDFATFTLTRWGDTNVAYTIPCTAFTVAGTATYGVDYIAGPQTPIYSAPATAGTQIGSITVNAGDITEAVEVGLPQLHSSFTGNETITLSATGGTSGAVNYTFNSPVAAVMLLDNLNPPETMLWSDPLTNVNGSTNWNVAFSQNTGISPYEFFYTNFNGVPAQDFDLDFAYSLAYDFVNPSPSGATVGMRMTVNKLGTGAVGTGASRAAGINIYPANAPTFSNNFALRFSMNLVRGCADATATEAVLFGINHYGTNLNWWLGSGVEGTGTNAFSFTNADGIWFQVEADGGQAGNVGNPTSYPSDIMIFTGTNGAAKNDYFPSTGYWPLGGMSWAQNTNVFKNFGDAYNNTGSDVNDGLYNAQDDQLSVLNDAGVPANVSGWFPDAYSTGTCTPPGTMDVGPWTDVEVKQYNNVITMSMNKTVMFVYTNATPFTNGQIMLGYMDPYDSLGNGGGVYFSDVRVISLAPTIASAVVTGANMTITFTSPDPYAVTGSFRVLGSSTVNGTYTAQSATITEANGVFTAVTPYSGAANASEYYVIDQISQ